MKEKDWIKAEESLPQTDESVLVYDDAFGVLVASYIEGYGWQTDEHGYLECVTHWMPIVLPKSNVLWKTL